MSRVDVAIPAYNQGRFLNDCVRSVVAQPVDLRVLIVDDCSSDDTPTVAAGLVAEDSRIEYRRHAKNMGATATFNECLDWATSEYTHLIAADDCLTPGALVRNIRLLDTNPRIGFVYGRMIIYRDGDPFPSFDQGQGPVRSSIVGGRDFIEQTCKRGANLVPGLTVTVRTALQKRIGGFHAALPLTHDMEMWLRFAAGADVGRIDADQAVYRVHGNNLHLKFDRLASIIEHKKTFDKFFREHDAGLADPDQLHVFAERGLAERALFEGQSAFEEGDNALTGQILTTAHSLWPAHVRTWEYKKLRLKHKVGLRKWRFVRRCLQLRQVQRGPSLAGAAP